MWVDCFKPYDIRGIVPEQLNNELAYAIGRALVEETKGRVFLVGQDIRESSSGLSKALIKGFIDCGANVIDIGLCGTEEVYFATGYYGTDGGVMITASHNPKNYNGMKLVGKGVKPIGQDTGLERIRLRLETGDLGSIQSNKGKITQKTNKGDYIDYLVNCIDASKCKKLKILMNPGNGSAGLILEQLAPRLPFELVLINEKPDGSFPNGVPNPMLSENRVCTQKAVVEHQCDLGIAWDSDFDRCFFFDGNGNFVENYYVIGLLAKSLLEKEKTEARVVYEPRLTWNTIETVKKFGGVPVISRTGHAFMKDKMRKVDAIYGGEISAHHYFRDFYYCDSGMIPWLLVAELLSRSEQELSDLVKDSMMKHACSGELNYDIPDTDIVFERVLKHFSSRNPKIDNIDGLSMEFKEWRFNLRKSNTEPLLRLNVEVLRRKDSMKLYIDELEQIIKA